MIVDDSAMVREFVRETLAATPDLELTAAAADPYLARDKMKRLRPDVIILDVEMPRMDGITFLQKLMAARPTPVVMFSSRTQAGAETTLKALELGAVDFVAKPTRGLADRLPETAAQLVDKVRGAARAKVRRKGPSPGELAVPQRVEVDQVVRLAKAPPRPGGPMVVLMGASTGGTVALERVLTRMPADSPPIAVVQHMPQHFTDAFARRLDERSQMAISEARDKQTLSPGQAVIAPGGRHLLLERSGGGYWAHITEGPPVNRHRPSVDVLFRSGVNSAGPNAVAVLLTGMGDDGARGMSDLHQAGAFTIAQNEETSTVYGMPKAAVERGAADRVVPIDSVAPLLVGLWTKGRERERA
jgi:two-component system chemotaxis response regulator CheB